MINPGESEPWFFRFQRKRDLASGEMYRPFIQTRPDPFETLRNETCVSIEGAKLAISERVELEAGVNLIRDPALVDVIEMLIRTSFEWGEFNNW